MIAENGSTASALSRLLTLTIPTIGLSSIPTYYWELNGDGEIDDAKGPMIQVPLPFDSNVTSQQIHVLAMLDGQALQITKEIVWQFDRWRNPELAGDVNGSGSITALDALLIVNELGRRRGNDDKLLPVVLDRAGVDAYFDTNGDSMITPLDALLVINQIAIRNRQSVLGAEVMAAPTIADAAANDTKRITISVPTDVQALLV